MSCKHPLYGPGEAQMFCRVLRAKQRNNSTKNSTCMCSENVRAGNVNSVSDLNKPTNSPLRVGMIPDLHLFCTSTVKLSKTIKIPKYDQAKWETGIQHLSRFVHNQKHRCKRKTAPQGFGGTTTHIQNMAPWNSITEALCPIKVCETGLKKWFHL